MAISDVAAPAVNLFGDTFGSLFAKYWWVLFIFVGIAVAIGVVLIVGMIRKKKAQWTHTLIVRRVLANNILSKPYEHKMRRFPEIKRAEVFELEKPLLGGFLMPELEEYSDTNEYSIILDKNNRIYTNKGEFFDPNKSSVNVSAKHAEIDISRSNLRSEFQNIHKASDKITWATIAKWAFFALLIISIMIVSIVAIGEWGESHTQNAKAEVAQAEAFANLADAMETSQATVNTQLLIIDKLNELYGTNNIQRVIEVANNNNGTV